MTVEWGGYEEEEHPPYFPLYDPPTKGSTKDYMWYMWQGSWGKIFDGEEYHHLKAQIEADSVPVPEPGILIFLCISMISVAGLRRWWKE